MSIVVTSNQKTPAPISEAKAPEANAKEKESTPAPETKVTEQKPISESGTEVPKVVDSGSEVEVESEKEPKDELDANGQKKTNGVQKRINKLNAKISAKDQEIEFWRQQALKGAGESIRQDPAPKADVSEGKPNAEQFETHPEYIEALTDWKTEQKFKEREQKEQKTRFEKEQEDRAKTYNERAKSFAEKNQDFFEVEEALDEAMKEAKVGVSPAMRELFVSSENGPELAYELAKNPEEFIRVCKLSPLAAAKEIGKIEARLVKASEPNKETKKIRNAPKPLAPVGSGGKGAAIVSLQDAAKRSFAEYESFRREQMKKKSASW